MTVRSFQHKMSRVDTAYRVNRMHILNHIPINVAGKTKVHPEEMEGAVVVEVRPYQQLLQALRQFPVQAIQFQNTANLGASVTFVDC